MTSQQRQHKIKLRQFKKEEEGIALTISLLMGALLITGATGLLIRQLTARKLSATESYQQMAETAASNGFNRILAVLNNASTDDYRGYLFTENNEPDTWLWSEPYNKSEFCAGQIGLPVDTDTAGSDSTLWPSSPAGFALNTKTLRGDGKGTVQAAYRLRSYAKDFAAGRGSGTFEVEGIISRVDGDPTTTDPVLARARLTRSLQLESAIARAQDWGIIGTRFFNDEGSTEIIGPGRFLWFVDSANTALCEDNFNTVSGETPNVVWPVLRDSDTPYIPNPSVYNRDGTQDEIGINGQRYIRIWSFDDTHSRGDNSAPCEGALVCTRPGNNGNEQIPNISDIIDNRATDSSGQTDSEEDDIEYKTFRLSKNGKKLYIGTCITTAEPEINCNSDNRSWGNSNWQWNGPYTWKDKIPGSSITRWRFKPRDPSTKQIGTCNRRNAINCDYDNGNYWEWDDIEQINSEDNTTDSPVASNIVKIDSSDICQQSSNSDVCHIYIEHLRLTNTKVFIKNDTRAIVLHLNLEEGVNRSNWLTANGHEYSLGANSQLCGVNSQLGSSPICNNNAVQFVVTAKGSSNSKSCPESSKNDDFIFSGNSLPAAWISMAQGRIRPINASIRGVLWSSAICNKGNLKITTEADDGTASTTQAKQYWNFSDNGGIGKRIVRGIRGSGFDIFKRW